MTISWYSISISLQKNSDIILNGYFSVDSSTNVIQSFYNVLNPGVNILSYSEDNYNADYVFVNNNFTVGGTNINSIPALDAEYNAEAFNLWYDPTALAPDDVFPFTNISYKNDQGEWIDILPYGKVFNFSFQLLSVENNIYYDYSQCAVNILSAFSKATSTHVFDKNVGSALQLSTISLVDTAEIYFINIKKDLNQICEIYAASCITQKISDIDLCLILLILFSDLLIILSSYQLISELNGQKFTGSQILYIFSISNIANTLITKYSPRLKHYSISESTTDQEPITGHEAFIQYTSQKTYIDTQRLSDIVNSLLLQ